MARTEDQKQFASICAKARVNIDAHACVVRDGEEIPITWSKTIGPKAVTADAATISIHTVGFEYDGIEGTENAGSSYRPATLNFTSGRRLEERNLTGQSVVAFPLKDDDFEYKIYFDWSVKYVDPPP